MAYWLFKSEPEAWSWEEQLAAGAKGTEWTGVRNFQARNMMRQMQVGERGFFYHSGEVRAVVGVVEVIATAHPDSTAEAGDWECVDLAAVEPMPRPVTLAEVKAMPSLAQMALVKNSRLSVQPVTDAEWTAMMTLAGKPEDAAAAEKPAAKTAPAKTEAAPVGKKAAPARKAAAAPAAPKATPAEKAAASPATKEAMPAKKVAAAPAAKGATPAKKAAASPAAKPAPAAKQKAAAKTAHKKET